MAIFSIVIPTYNSGAHIEKALENILTQQFKDFEVLIIDAMSSDNTLEIVNSYLGKIDNIHILSEKDKGIYDAMNKGINLAKGEWIYFMGCDDCFYDSLVLQRMHEEILKEKDVDILYGNVKGNYFSDLTDIYDGPFTKEKLETKNICHQAMFFRKTVFNTVGLFNISYKTNADWDLNLKCFYSNKIRHRFVDMIVANYAGLGVSAFFSDNRFRLDKPWLIAIHKKKQLSLVSKLKAIRAQLIWRIKSRQYQLLVKFILRDSYRIFFW